MDALNAYRLSEAPHLPEVVASGECGDGEIRVKYELIPEEGTLFTLTQFRFLRCESAGHDPFDRMACPRLLRIAGQYRYFVEWADGTTSQGTLPRITAGQDDDEVIEIGKPGG